MLARESQQLNADTDKTRVYSWTSAAIYAEKKPARFVGSFLVHCGNKGIFQAKTVQDATDYDENHKCEMDKLEKAISGMIEAGKVKSRNVADQFKDLCNKFCQILVDGAGQAHFRLLVDFGDVLNRVLKV